MSDDRKAWERARDRDAYLAGLAFESRLSQGDPEAVRELAERLATFHEAMLSLGGHTRALALMLRRAVDRDGDVDLEAIDALGQAVSEHVGRLSQVTEGLGRSVRCAAARMDRPRHQTAA